MIRIEEIPVERINEYWDIQFRYLVDDGMITTDEEKEYMVTMRPSTTFFQDGIARLKKNKVAMVSFCIIVIMAFRSAFGSTNVIGSPYRWN